MGSGVVLPQAAGSAPGEPLPVFNPGAGQYSWLVPLVYEDAMIGFVEISTTGSFLRSASFGTAQSLSAWTNGAEIKAVAERHREPDERFGEPQLTYDGAPTRTAWAVPVFGNGGLVATIFVTGADAYRRDAVTESAPSIDGLGRCRGDSGS